jgi:uncharacterized protein YcbK (DUF882 family)
MSLDRRCAERRKGSVARKIALRGAAGALAAGAVLALAMGLAHADVTYVVERGHTLEAIAHQYRVPAESIVEANHLKDPQHLRVGQRLVIPGVDDERKESPRDKGNRYDRLDKRDEERGASTDFPMAPGPFERDVIHAARPEEAFHIRVKDAHGKIPAASLREFEQMMRQGAGPTAATHPPDPRLVALIGLVSNHFGGRTLEIVSGYRAYKPTQFTPDSRHNYGRALDFRVRGVNNETLRDFCRSLHNTGCGYYPNSSFVHMDVRDSSAYWVDLARPGEAPHYDRVGVYADEGTSDVTPDSH